MKKSVFIYGILPRSGTNLLNKILQLHPECVEPAVKVRENWFVHFSDHLYSYSDKLFKKWSNPKWGGAEYSEKEFFETIGTALIDYISKDIPNISDKYLVSKTPSVYHLERCFELFPSSKILIIVRDGRDVAASAFKTWGKKVEKSVYDWNVGCRRIAEFEKQTSPDKYLLVRYEDLVLEKEKWTKACLDFLGLNEKTFSWNFLSELPIFGSSENKTWGEKKMNDSFQPIGRWEGLPKGQIKKMDKISSDGMSYFGYPELAGKMNPLPKRKKRLEQNIQDIGREPVGIKHRAKSIVELAKQIPKAETGSDPNH